MLKHFLIKVCLLFKEYDIKFRKVAYSFYLFCYKLSKDYLSFFFLETLLFEFALERIIVTVFEILFYRNEKQEEELKIFE